MMNTLYNAETNEYVNTDNNEIGFMADYTLKSKNGKATWYTTEAEMKMGRRGGYMKVWSRDRFETIGKPEDFKVISDRHIVWTHQYI